MLYIRHHLNPQTFRYRQARQDFNFKAVKNSSNPTRRCFFRFDSEVWQAQTKGKPTSFRYLKQPDLAVNPTLLMGGKRHIDFSFKLLRIR